MIDFGVITIINTIKYLLLSSSSSSACGKVEPYTYLIENIRVNWKTVCEKSCAKTVKKVISLWNLFIISIVFNRFHKGSTEHTCGKMT